MNNFKNLLFILLIATSIKLNGQNNIYLDIKNKIAETYPDINLNNKLIAINFWESKNLESRECNKQFDKVYSVYEFAKLNGGSKGIICFTVCIDENLAEISNQKDGIKKLLALAVSSKDGLKNVVFNTNGEEVYKNIESKNIFENIHQLITR